MKKDPLPADFVDYIRRLFLLDPRHNIRRIHRWMILRWTLWSDGIETNSIPGYPACPAADDLTGFPAGWSMRKFHDIAREAIGTDTIHRARKAAASPRHDCGSGQDYGICKCCGKGHGYSLMRNGKPTALVTGL